MTVWQIFLICMHRTTVITMNTILIYIGAASIAALFLYSTKSYFISLVAGFISFCVFYFSFARNDFEWQINFLLELLKESAIIYFISFAATAIFYRIVPFHKQVNPINKKGSVKTPPDTSNLKTKS
jgi:hypothetical protein